MTTKTTAYFNQNIKHPTSGEMVKFQIKPQFVDDPDQKGTATITFMEKKGGAKVLKTTRRRARSIWKTYQACGFKPTTDKLS